MLEAGVRLGGGAMVDDLIKKTQHPVFVDNVVGVSLPSVACQ